MKRAIFSFVLSLVCVPFLMGQNPRNILIYNLTSTDCGPCSCMDSLFERIILPEFPRTIIVALHGIGSAFRGYQGDSARDYFRASYEPSGFIDGLGYDVDYTAIKDSLTHRYAQFAEAPVNIHLLSKSWDPNTRQVNFSMDITNLGTELPGLYNINVIVTENNLYHQHRTATGCSTPDNPYGLPFRDNYYNHWVARSFVYYSFGDSLIGPSWPAQQTISRSCSFHVDTAWAPQNCNFVVVVYRNADSLYKANVQQAIIQSVTNGIGIPDDKPDPETILRIFPNPSNGPANIHLNILSEGFYRLTIFDVNGNEVENLLQDHLKPGILNLKTNIRKYPSSIYVAVLTTPWGTIREKFIIP